MGERKGTSPFHERISTIHCRLSVECAKRLDSLQRHLISYMRPVRPKSGETVTAFVRRRRQTCGRVASTWGTWSKHWAYDVIQWNEHISRAHDPHNWCFPLREWHGQTWLQAHRFENSAGSRWGRTRTRASPGHPAIRWEEGVRAAHSVIKQ